MANKLNSESNSIGYHFQRARVIDPKSGTDREQDLIIKDGKLSERGRGLATPKGVVPIDAHGLLVVPGLVDLHAHLREPGEEYKEDFMTASAAAAFGGFTSICAMPNTKPPNDSRAITELIISRTRALGGVRVYPVGAITMGLQGNRLTEIGELKDAGVVAISDDGRPVMNSRVMRRALEYGRTFGVPVIQHAEDLNLSEGGVMHEGSCSTRIGLKGQPSQAESVIVARDLALVELTGARYHIAHVSTQESIQHIREAKRKGLPVTCEVTPHHLMLTDEACMTYDTATRVNPPLRGKEDIEALRQALADGTIDAVATDHAPHSSIEKQVEFDCSAFGAIGFETALALVLRLVEKKEITLMAAIERLTWGPARALSLPGGTLQEGMPGDLTCIDLDQEWTVDPDTFRSKSRNSPFLGWKLKGKAVMTIVGGKMIHDERNGGS